MHMIIVLLHIKKILNFTHMKKNFLTIIVVFLIHSCTEKDVINSPLLTSTQACQDHLTAEEIFNDIILIIQKGLTDNSNNKSCPNFYLINNNTFDIDTLIINFGNSSPGCLYNGKIRSGEIIVFYTGKYLDSLSVITTNFENYYTNNILVQGEVIITNQGKNINNKTFFNVEISSTLSSEIGTIDWTSNIVRVWERGQNTINTSDDQFNITGSSSGNSVNGNDFQTIILDSQKIDLGCIPYCVIKSGTTKVRPSQYPERIIEYGDSLCDCNVNVKIEGSNYPLIIDN